MGYDPGVQKVEALCKCDRQVKAARSMDGILDDGHGKLVATAPPHSSALMQVRATVAAETAVAS